MSKWRIDFGDMAWCQVLDYDAVWSGLCELDWIAWDERVNGIPEDRSWEKMGLGDQDMRR